MIEAVLALVAPFVVRYATSIVKAVPMIANAASWRIPVIRALVAVLSLIAAVLTQMLGEGEVDPALVDTAVLTVFNAAVATWLYARSKK